jgi:phosphopantothenate---cysteine ligase (ATP)
VVIGNDLNRRKWEVVFVERRKSTSVGGATADALFTETWLRIRPGEVKEIEEDIVEELVRRHRVWIGE